MLSACGGDLDVFPEAPSGLSYTMPSAIYEAGLAIVPNRPSVGGGPVDRYTVAPPLPAGLALDPDSGVISGAPSLPEGPAVYVVTASNIAGAATARLEIEVRDRIVAPASLQYDEANVVYTVGTPIPDNAPTSSGGPITRYAITPALPQGLSLDATTGVISGTPETESRQNTYTVNGANDAGSVDATLDITVEPALAPPATLSYDVATPLYMVGEAIPANRPQTTGGPVTHFSVTPTLPTGLGLNAETGVLSGTPTALQTQAPYVITASNAAGSTHTALRITVTGLGHWQSAAAMPQGLAYVQAVGLNDGRVLITGGYSAAGPSASAALYDPDSDSWIQAAPMLQARYGHTTTVLADGRVLVAGGSNGERAVLRHAEIYDPATDTWTPTADMNQPRDNHSASRLPDGTILVIGGTTSLSPIQFTASMEQYDPATDRWTTWSRSLEQARTQHAAALTPDGSAVMVMGGINNDGTVSYAELLPFDETVPRTVFELPSLRHNVTQSVTLTDGTILATGDGSATALLYDHAENSWVTSTMNARRSQPALVPLADGRVLAAGGVIGSARSATSEIYNPGVNAWTTAAPMAIARNVAGAVPLPDGGALVLGGFNQGVSLDALERYSPE